MALRQGKMKKYGDEQLGIPTADPRTCQTWEEFFDLYKQQHQLFLRACFTQQLIVNKTRPRHFAAPMLSAMHDLCMKHNMDLHSEHIPEGAEFGYYEFMGLGTVIDSLAAVKKLVFEEKRITMAELMEAIDANWVGYEAIQQMVKSCPCYGNDDDYVDSIGKELDLMCVKFTRKYNKELGMNNDVRYVPFTSHVPFGKVRFF